MKYLKIKNKIYKMKNILNENDNTLDIVEDKICYEDITIETIQN